MIAVRRRGAATALRIAAMFALVFVLANLWPHAACAQTVDPGWNGGADPTVQASTSTYDHALLDKMVQAFVAPASRLAANARNAASGLFGALVGIELTWYTVLLLKRQHDVADIATSHGFKLTSLAFMIALFTNSNAGLDWTHKIVQAFTGAGQQITASTLTPSDVLSDGIDFIAQLMQTDPHIGENGIQNLPFDLANNFVPGLILLLAMVSLMVSFGMVTFMLLLFQVESVVAIPVVCFQLAFLGSRWTLPWAQGAISYLVNLGVRIMTLGIVLALGLGVLQDGLQTLIHAGPPNSLLPPPIYFIIAMVSLIFAGMCIWIPRMAASAMTGNPAMSIGTLFAGASMVTSGAKTLAVGAVLSHGLTARAEAGGKGLAAGAVGALGGAGISRLSPLAERAAPVLRASAARADERSMRVQRAIHGTAIDPDTRKPVVAGRGGGSLAAIRRVAPPRPPDDSGTGGATIKIAHHE